MKNSCSIGKPTPRKSTAPCEFFHRTDPRWERDVHGLLFGFKDHPWRGKVSKKLELLLYDDQFLQSRIHWEAYIRWMVPEDLNQILLHMAPNRAGEFRPQFLERIAEYRTPAVCQIMVDGLDGVNATIQKAHSIQLIKELGGRLCLNLMFPYVWHPDEDLGQLAARYRHRLQLGCEPQALPGARRNHSPRAGTAGRDEAGTGHHDSAAPSTGDWKSP